MRRSPLRWLFPLVLPLLLLAQAPREPQRRVPVDDPIAALRTSACGSPTIQALAAASDAIPCAEAAQVTTTTALAAQRPFAALPASNGDGTLVNRQRIITVGNVALDLVAYLSSGLVVGGLLCYVDDGQPRTTILHLHGGFGGIFVNPDGGDTIGTCYRWAASHGRTAFVPSFRGQDGGQGTPELCLGEAQDVVAAAQFLRGLDVVDPDRLALIGGSMGGCVALRAGTRIPNLRAVVAIAPPTDWKSLVAYHRNDFAPAVETRCDGSTLDWTQGGEVFADTIDQLICGHPGCSDDDYNLRSPLPEVVNSPNPTLVLAAGGDNLVPPIQQLYWSLFRNSFEPPLSFSIRDRCSEVSSPPKAKDVLVYVPGAYHLMEDGPIVSALVWLTEMLDAPDPPASEAL